VEYLFVSMRSSPPRWSPAAPAQGGTRALVWHMPPWSSTRGLFHEAPKFSPPATPAGK
jgi:hypothetical protein